MSPTMRAILAGLLLTGLAAPALTQPDGDRCEVSGKPRWQCCPRKSSPMPPCCQKRCSTPTWQRQSGSGSGGPQPGSFR